MKINAVLSCNLSLSLGFLGEAFSGGYENGASSASRLGGASEERILERCRVLCVHK